MKTSDVNPNKSIMRKEEDFEFEQANALEEEASSREVCVAQKEQDKRLPNRMQMKRIQIESCAQYSKKVLVLSNFHYNLLTATW